MTQSKPQPSVKSFDSLFKEMRDRYRTFYSLSGNGGVRGLAVAFSKDEDHPVSAAMAAKIIKERYEPHTSHIRKSLGLPNMKPVAVCADCGEPHMRKSKRCPNAPRPEGTIKKPRTNWRGLSLLLAGVIVNGNYRDKRE